MIAGMEEYAMHNVGVMERPTSEAELYMKRHDKAELLFQALLHGKAEEVRAMLREDPTLVFEHCPHHFDASAMNLAAMGGSTEAVDAVLAAGASVDDGSEWWAGSFSPLMSAILGKNEAMIAHLIAKGAAVSAYEAAAMGDADMLRKLLDEKPESVNMRGGDGQTPLHVAETVEVAALLLDRGAELETLDVDHQSTPVQYAISRPHVAELLLRRGAKGDVFIYSALESTSRLEEELKRNPTAVHERIEHENFPTTPPAASAIYFYVIGEGCTPLHAAAAYGKAEACRMLLQHGADPNARGGYDDSMPLHQAAWCNNAGAIRALADDGANLNARSGCMHNNSPLGWAVVGGSAEAVEALVALGAEVWPSHKEDAKAGADGRFMQYKRQEIESWRRVAGLIGD